MAEQYLNNSWLLSLALLVAVQISLGSKHELEGRAALIQVDGSSVWPLVNDKSQRGRKSIQVVLGDGILAQARLPQMDDGTDEQKRLPSQLVNNRLIPT